MKMTDSQRAVYLLLHAEGVGRGKCSKVLDNFADAGVLYNQPERHKAALISLLGIKEYENFLLCAKNTDFELIENRLAALNASVICVGDQAYPESLARLDDKPLLLYCRGDISLLNMPAFAVVGTRYPTRYGIRVTEEFSSKLSERFCIVSGLARGVDACAHRAAIENGGKTIGVLGCGIDVVYPSENADLYREIIKVGLIISEYDIGAAAVSYNFPQRNRIVSGLSRGVLVTEAGEKSGTMITIRCAESQGVGVFCVPGSIYNPASSGCNYSLRECQSRIALNVNDIYAEMGIKKTDPSPPTVMQLDINEDAVVTALTANGEMHFEELAEISDLPVPKLTAMLVRMEAAGIIYRTKFNYWSV